MNNLDQLKCYIRIQKSSIPSIWPVFILKQLIHFPFTLLAQNSLMTSGHKLSAVMSRSRKKKKKLQNNSSEKTTDIFNSVQHFTLFLLPFTLFQLSFSVVFLLLFSLTKCQKSFFFFFFTFLYCTQLSTSRDY